MQFANLILYIKNTVLYTSDWLYYARDQYAYTNIEMFPERWFY